MDIRPFQIFVAASSLVASLLVLELIRRRKIKDELWLPLLLAAATPFVASLWIAPWAKLAHLLGIAYEPALLLMVGVLFCLALILYLAVVVSTLLRQNLRIAQELALLRARLDAVDPARRSG